MKSKLLRINQKVKIYFYSQIFIGVVFEIEKYRYWITFVKETQTYYLPFNKSDGMYDGTRYSQLGGEIFINFETIKNVTNK